MSLTAELYTMTLNNVSNDSENYDFENIVTQLFHKERLEKSFASKLDVFQQQIRDINNFAHKYDPKTGLKTNGYRSFLKVLFDNFLRLWKGPNSYLAQIYKFEALDFTMETIPKCGLM